MSNIHRDGNNISNVTLRVLKSDYWDLTLSNCEHSSPLLDGGRLYDDSVISLIDFGDLNYFSGDTVYSSIDYKWHDSVSDGVVLKNMGLTGIDNGLIKIDVDYNTLQEQYNIFTGSTLGLVSGDTRLSLHLVSGGTKEFVYPVSLIDKTLKLMGGFYQGFFKSGNSYSVLPSNFNSEMCFDFILKPDFLSSTINNTLNSVYPNNKGFFFYMGLRAENKFWFDYDSSELDKYLNNKTGNFYFGDKCYCDTTNDTCLTYTGDTTYLNEDSYFDGECVSKRKITFYFGDKCYCGTITDTCIDYPDDVYYLEEDDYLNFECEYINKGIVTFDGFDVSLQGVYENETDNKFVLFNRGVSGVDVNNFNPNITYFLTGQTRYTPNYYLYSNRTETGYTTGRLRGLDLPNPTYTVASDIVNNAIGFRIKDDGSIGYRTIIESCTIGEEFSIVEEYSAPGLILNGNIAHVSVRMVYNKCFDVYHVGTRKYQLLFYVNAKLVLVSKWLPELMFRELNDLQEKQEGVPFNISIGGGTQGLCDMIGFNSKYLSPYLFPLEKNFGGSFIGEIYKFRINDGKLDFSKIKNNYDFELKPVIPPVIDYIEPTINFTILGIDLILPETNLHRESGNITTLLGGNITQNDSRYPITNYKLYLHNNNTKTQINGDFIISETGGTITQYEHLDLNLNKSGFNDIEYSIIVFDTNTLDNGTKKTKKIIFDDMIFYGGKNTQTIAPSEIRDLSNKVFNNNNTTSILFETGIINNIFVIAVPFGKEVVKVIDSDAMNIELTDFFIKTVDYIPNYGGKLTPYNIYTMENAIPYSKNHTLKITFE